VGRPLEELVSEIGVSPDVDAGLLGETTPLGRVRALALAFEDAAWTRVSELATQLGVPEAALPDIAVESLAWAADTLPR
jgi:c-di-GMP-related signal transduction protein